MEKLLDALSSPRRSSRDLSLNILVTLALAVLFSLINPNFIDQYNLISIGQNLAPYAILALGVIMPISMGGTDLSIGAVCIGAAVVGGKLHSMGVPLVACLPAMLAVGCLVGLVNGYLVAKRGLQPFVATLGTMMFVRGATAIFANTANVTFPTDSWYNALFSTWRGFPTSFLWIALFAGVMHFIYRKTKIGRYLLSIGSNEKATRISGVDVDKYIIVGYLGSGLMAGIASIFWSASFTTVAVATGNGMELDAIAADYIGGTAATGGLANVFGSVIGSIMLVIIRSGLNFSLARLDVPVNSTYVTYVISGVIIIAAVLAEKAKSKGALAHKASNPRRQAKMRLASNVASLVLLCGLVITAVHFSGSTKADVTDSKTICILMKSDSSEFWGDVAAGAQAAGDELGYKVICRGPKVEDASSLPEQREMLSTMLAESPAGIGVATIAEGFSDLLVNAYEGDIPIVQLDSGIYPDDLATITASSTNPLVSYVAANDYDNAAQLAQYAFSSVREDISASDEYVVGIIQHATNESAAHRAKGFAETFEELAEADPQTAGKCRILIEAKPSEVNNAYKEALEYLYEKDADLVFGTNQVVVNQCFDAVASAGGKYDGVSFVGYDDGEKVREWMNGDSKSPLLVSISQNPYQMGYLTAKTIAEVADGNEVAEVIPVPGELVTPD